jgi:hypothetical protein
MLLKLKSAVLIENGKEILSNAGYSLFSSFSFGGIVFVSVIWQAGYCPM